METETITLTKPPKITPSIQIVDEGADFIVVNKPPFMQAHPSKPGERQTLWNVLRELLAYEIVNGGQVSIINRLDRETSGLTLVAKTRLAARTFCREMEARRVSKEYLALVWGWPAKQDWMVDAPILREGAIRPAPIYLRQTVHPDGAPAKTRFTVEQNLRLETTNGDRFSIVRASPETGRMHQIRVHLAHSGFPIVGDKLYGPDPGCYLEFVRTGWTPSLERRLLLPRHALHSAVLRLEESGQAWSAPLPRDLRVFTDSEESSGNLLAASKWPTL